MSNDQPPKPDPLASLQLPAIPLVPGVERKPYRRGTYEAARLRRERRGRTGAR